MAKWNYGQGGEAQSFVTGAARKALTPPALYGHADAYLLVNENAIFVQPPSGNTASAIDSVAFTDAAIGASLRVAAATDGVSFTDSAAAAAGSIPANSSDSLSLSDVAFAALVAVATAADSVGLADAASAVSARVASANDALAFADAAAASVQSSGAVAADAVGFGDTASATANRQSQQTTATPGRPWRAPWPQTKRQETEAEKLARRLTQGTISVPMLAVPMPADVESTASVQQSPDHSLAMLQGVVLRAQARTAQLKAHALALERKAIAAQAVAQIDQEIEAHQAADLQLRQALAEISRRIEMIRAEEAQAAQQIEEADVAFVATLLATL